MIDTGFIDWNEHGLLLLEEDWIAMESAIDEFDVKSVIEFGSGASTRLFCAKGLKVICFEQDPAHADRVQARCPSADIRPYDGSVLRGPTADMVFVDAPWCNGKDPRFPDRRNAYISALGMQASVIACHDIERPEDWALEKEFIKSAGKLVFYSRICHVYKIGA